MIILTSKILDEEERRALKAQAMAVLSKESKSQETVVKRIRDTITKIAYRSST